MARTAWPWPRSMGTSVVPIYPPAPVTSTRVEPFPFMQTHLQHVISRFAVFAGRAGPALSERRDEFGQARLFAILIGENRVGHPRPFDGEISIIPKEPLFVMGRVIFANLIDDFGIGLQGHEPVRKADRHQNLVPFLSRDD